MTSSDSGDCTIVMYHYVRDADRSAHPGIKGLSVARFREQIEHIANTYTVIRLDDYVDMIAARRDPPRRACILTFDDGLRDHYDTALPILRSFGLPATFFVITLPLRDGAVPAVHQTHFLLSKIGTTRLAAAINEVLARRFPDLFEEYQVDATHKKDPARWRDDTLTANVKTTIGNLSGSVKAAVLDGVFAEHFPDRRAFCQDLYMSVGQLRDLVRCGMAVGAHSHSHPSLGGMARAEQEQELAVSRAFLEEHIGIEITAVSYPYGSADRTTMEVAGAVGYKCGLLDEGGPNAGCHVDLFALKRVDANDVSPAHGG